MPYFDDSYCWGFDEGVGAAAEAAREERLCPGCWEAPRGEHWQYTGDPDDALCYPCRQQLKKELDMERRPE